MVTASPTSPSVSEPLSTPSPFTPSSATTVHPLKAALVPPPSVATTMAIASTTNATTTPIFTVEHLETDDASPAIPHLDGLEEVSSLDDVPLPYTILYHALVFKDEMPLAILMERHQTGLDQLQVWIHQASALVASIEHTRLQDVQPLEQEVLDVISGLHRYEATVESSLEILQHLEETIHPRLRMTNTDTITVDSNVSSRRMRRRARKRHMAGGDLSSSSDESLSDMVASNLHHNQQQYHSSVQQVRKQWQQLLASITGISKTVREHQRLRLGLQSVDNLSEQVREASGLLDRCIKAIESDRIDQQQQQKRTGQTTPTLADVRQQAFRAGAGSLRHLPLSSSTMALQATTNNDMLELESRMGLLSIQIASLQKSFPECKASLWARRRSSATSHSSQATAAASQQKRQQQQRRRNSQQESTAKLRPLTALDGSQPSMMDSKNHPDQTTATSTSTTNVSGNDSAIKEQKLRLFERYRDLMAAWQELRTRKKKLWRDMEDLDRWRCELSERSEAIVQMLVPIQSLHQQCYKFLESLDKDKTLQDEQLLPQEEDQQQKKIPNPDQPPSSPPHKQQRRQSSQQPLPVHLRLYQSKSAQDELSSRSSSSSRHQRQSSSFSGRSQHSMTRSMTAPAAANGLQQQQQLRDMAGIDPRQQRVLDTLAFVLKNLEQQQLNTAPSIENMFWMLQSDLQLPGATSPAPSAPPSPSNGAMQSPQQPQPEAEPPQPSQQQLLVPVSPVLATPVTTTMPTTPNSPGSPGQVAPPTPRVCFFNSVHLPFYPTADMVERHRALKEQWSELKTSLDQMGPRLSAHFAAIQMQIQDAMQASAAAAAAAQLRKEQDEGDNRTLVGGVDGNGTTGGSGWRSPSSGSSPILRRAPTIGRQIVVSPGWNPSTRVASPKWGYSSNHSLVQSSSGDSLRGYRRRFMLVTSELPGGSKGRPWCPSVSVTSPGLPGFPQTISTWGYFIVGPNGEILPDLPRPLSPFSTSPSPSSPFGPRNSHTLPNLKDTRPPFSPGGNRPYTSLSQNRPMYGGNHGKGGNGAPMRAMSVQSNKNRTSLRGGGAGGPGNSLDGASEPNLPTSMLMMMSQAQPNRNGQASGGAPLKLQQRRRGSKHTMPPGQLWIPASGLSSSSDVVSGESRSSLGSWAPVSNMVFLSDEEALHDDDYDDDDDDDYDGERKEEYYAYLRRGSTTSSSSSRFSASHHHQRQGSQSRSSGRSSRPRIWSPLSAASSTTSSQYHPWSTNPMVAAARSSAALHATLLARGPSISPGATTAAASAAGLGSRAMSASPPTPTASAFQQGVGRKIWLHHQHEQQKQQQQNGVLAALSFTVPKFSM
ncbi:hypothetical protein BGZ73_001751 [Actinomortierella ambigua]|nr:hypothetical protein BGZ73_001751 [Actinomortierella ambigua]